MTVSYAYEVATSNFGCFLKLFYRWRASIYKLIWRDLLILLVVYYAISLVYQFILSEPQQKNFEKWVEYCKTSTTLIPLTFVLGFYVSIIVKRWWDQYCCLPWPDALAVYVSTLIHGHEERGRVMRRTIMRYCCACSTMVFALISPAVKKRFPTLNDLVDCGLLIENEKKIIDAMDEKFPKHSKNWMPIVWASVIAMRARREGRIRDDFSMTTIIDELNKHRDSCYRLIQYDIISIPLLYTQVVTLTVYSYFLAATLGKQYIHNSNDDLLGMRRYFPFFLILEFIFYMGWLKVAESLICPFGEDDDDFELNWMIDRNLQMSYLVVDEMHHEHPELVKDQYWDDIFPNELPYPDLLSAARAEPPPASTANIDISTKNKEKDNVLEGPSDVTVPSMHLYWRRTESTHYSPSEMSRMTQSRDMSKHSTLVRIYNDRDYDVELGQYRMQSIDDFKSVLSDSLTPEDSFDTLDSSDSTSSPSSDSQLEAFEMLRETRRLERLERQKRHIMHTRKTVQPLTIVTSYMPAITTTTTTTTIPTITTTSPVKGVSTTGVQTMTSNKKKKSKQIKTKVKTNLESTSTEQSVDKS